MPFPLAATARGIWRNPTETWPQSSTRNHDLRKVCNLGEGRYQVLQHP